MTAKHDNPQYRANARLIRAAVKSAWKRGEDVRCWRGGGPIPPGMPFDVGHKIRGEGHGLGNLGPEHRSKVPGCCDGNRADGGRVGARHTNRPTARPKATTWKL